MRPVPKFGQTAGWAAPGLGVWQELIYSESLGLEAMLWVTLRRV